MADEKPKSTAVSVAVKVVAFVVMVALVFVYLNLAFIYKGTGQTKGAFDSFYSLEDNTVDVMYIGASASSRYFISPLAYEEKGYSGFTLGPNGLPLYFVKHIIAETQKTQKPDLYVIELRSVTGSPQDVKEEMMRLTLDMMNLLSENRLQMAQDHLKYHPKSGSNLFELLVPIAKYHSRLLEGDMALSDYLLEAPVNRTLGFQISGPSLTQTHYSHQPYSEDIGEVNETAMQVLDDLLDYCENLDAQVLFVMAPYNPNQKRAEALNAAEMHVRDRGFNIVNFNHDELFNTVGINAETDFYNKNHVNYLGAEKYTRYLCDYLSEYYQLEDHRGDPAYSKWHSAYETYADFVSQGIKYYDDESDE